MRNASVLAAAAVVLAASVAACSSSSKDQGADPSGGTTKVGALSNGAAKEVSLTVPTVATIRSELPQAVRDKGTLVIGLGFLPAGSPPLGYVGTDQRTLTGSEPDLGRLIAAVLGLKPQLSNATWDNLFVGIDSGRTDAGISNITDTEQRKQKYDFACYRQDNVGFEVAKSSTWNFDGNYESLAGQTVAVGSGTNQEKILLEWQHKLQGEGKTLTIKHYPELNSTYLALNSGKIDANFAPNPEIAYHAARDANSPNPTRNAGTYSGAGATLQGRICATAKKGDGLVKPVADAINYLINNGQYAKWLAAWNLANEAVPTAQINPAGLPLSNS
jgi:polar amino acid transport system substrate-binding protein